MRGLAFHLNRRQELKAVDRAMDAVVVIHPMTALPQVWHIYSAHDAEGVSLLTWILFMLIGLVFLAYGVLHGAKPLIRLQVLWFIVDAAIVAGILLYG